MPNDSALQDELSELADERTAVLAKLSRRDKDLVQSTCEKFHEKREKILEKYSGENDLAKDRKAANIASKSKAAAKAADERAKAKQKKGKKKAAKKR